MNDNFKKLSAISAALLAGVLLSFLILLNSALGKRIGALESSFVAHFTGAILAFAIIAGGIRVKIINNAPSTPKYLFIGGILGVFITLAGNIAVPIIGLLLHMSILTTLDLAFSATADHFGLFGLPRFRIDVRRMVGLALSLIGVILIIWS